MGPPPLRVVRSHPVPAGLAYFVFWVFVRAAAEVQCSCTEQKPSPGRDTRAEAEDYSRQGHGNKADCPLVSLCVAYALNPLDD